MLRASASAASGGHPRGRARHRGRLRVLRTAVEYAAHPLGLDTPHPRLSWTLGSDAHDQLQSAYRIRVAPPRTGSAPPTYGTAAK